MAHSTTAALPGSEFHNFLFATIEEEQGGMPLSVLSALARLNVDPWQAAAQLATLPLDLATGKLTSWIATLPDGSTRADLGTIVPRLLALLPSSRTASSSSLSAAKRKVSGLTDPRRLKNVVYFVIVTAILLIGNRFMATRSVQAPIVADLAPVAVTVVPISSLPEATGTSRAATVNADGSLIEAD